MGSATPSTSDSNESKPADSCCIAGPAGYSNPRIAGTIHHVLRKHERLKPPNCARPGCGDGVGARCPDRADRRWRCSRAPGHPVAIQVGLPDPHLRPDDLELLVAVPEMGDLPGGPRRSAHPTITRPADLPLRL